MSLRTRFAVPLSALLLAFGATAQAQIGPSSSTDVGVDYSLSFDSLVGNHDDQADPSYLDSVDTGYGLTSVIAPVPEPETYAMLLAGLGLMGFVARRRQRNLSAN